MKKIGIVGGMGPMATAELFRKIIQYTDAASDQEHIRILIDNNPKIPDRTKAILEGTDSPVPWIQLSARGLISLGADFILIPCNTSHYFFDEIQKGLSAEVVNMIEETARAVEGMGIKKAGLLATTGTIQCGVYRRYFQKRGIELIQPDEARQNDVMNFIYQGVKASNYQFSAEPFERAARQLQADGAETLVLGCTELPIGIKMYGLKMDYVDSLDVLAKTAVVKAGYPLTKEAKQ